MAEKIGNAGSVKVRWWQPSVLELTWSGVIDGDCVSDAERQVIALMQSSARIACVLHDALAVTTYRSSVAAPASRLMSTLKSRGANEFVLITLSSAIRMMASTIAFGTGMSFRVVTDRAGAEALLAARATS